MANKFTQSMRRPTNTTTVLFTLILIVLCAPLLVGGVYDLWKTSNFYINGHIIEGKILNFETVPLDSGCTYGECSVKELATIVYKDSRNQDQKMQEDIANWTRPFFYYKVNDIISIIQDSRSGDSRIYTFLDFWSAPMLLILLGLIFTWLDLLFLNRRKLRMSD